MSRFLEKAKNHVVEKITDIPKPKASVDDFKLKDLSRNGVTYQANVGITNPYSRSIPICEISYVLKSNGRMILSGNIPDPGSIAGKERTALEVPIRVPHSILISLAKDVAKDWDIDYELEIGLIVDLPVIGNFTIPIRKKGEIKLPRLSSFF